MLLQSYLLVFYTKVLGVSGAVIGTMFLVTKFVDAFTDTAMGRIIDTHTDKNGRPVPSVDPSDGNPGRSGKRVDLQYFY